jgi:hypothetical protein
MAPAVGFEPTTNRLTADRSTTELRWIVFAPDRAAYILPSRVRAASATFFVRKNASGHGLLAKIGCGGGI